MAKKGKGLPRKYRQARAAARPAAKAAFPGKKKAFRKDVTSKVTAEDREIYRDIAKESKKGYITDEKGNKIRVKKVPTSERLASDRRAARAEVERKLALEDPESRASKSAARMEANRKAAIAKQEADRAARRGRPAPTLQQTPANEKPLSRPIKKAAAKPVAKKAAVKKAAVKPVTGTAGTVAKPKPGLAAQIKKDVAKVKTAKGMTRAEKSAANKAAWAKMSPAERKNWNANKPGSKGQVLIQGKKYDVASGAADKKMTELRNMQTPKAKPVYNVTTAQPEKASKGAKKAKFVQKNAPAKAAALKPESGKALAVRPKGAVATVAKEGAKKAAKAGALRTAGKVAGKLVGGRVGLGIAAASVLGKPVLKFLTQEPAGAKKKQDYSVKKEAIAKVKKDYSVKKQAVRPIPGGSGSTITPGSSYTVKKGDTLSGIAKTSGFSLSELRAANPKFTKNKKYKQGSAIWTGTKVRIPKK